jgi:hypothetical protein
MAKIVEERKRQWTARQKRHTLKQGKTDGMTNRRDRKESRTISRIDLTPWLCQLWSGQMKVL